MFDEIISLITTAFTIAVIVFVLCIVIAIIKGLGNHQKNAERIEKEQKENQKMINQIISDSKNFPTNVLISQRDDVQQAYNGLYDCKQRGSMKTKEILPFFRVGDDCGCSMDLETCDTVLKILNDEIQKRRG